MRPQVLFLTLAVLGVLAALPLSKGESFSALLMFSKLGPTTHLSSPQQGRRKEEHSPRRLRTRRGRAATNAACASCRSRHSAIASIFRRAGATRRAGTASCSLPAAASSNRLFTGARISSTTTASGAARLNLMLFNLGAAAGRPSDRMQPATTDYLACLRGPLLKEEISVAVLQ